MRYKVLSVNITFPPRKGKNDTPKSPTTPTSPMSPSFSPCAPLRSQLATGDSVRDKCIEMLAAALRTDGEAVGTPGLHRSQQPKHDKKERKHIHTQTHTHCMTIICRYWN